MILLYSLHCGIDPLICHIPQIPVSGALSSSNSVKGAEDDITAPMACSRCQVQPMP